MTKSSPSRIKKRLDGITFGDVLPANTIFPEDIPVLFRKTAEELAGAFFEENHRSKTFRGHWKIAAKHYVTLNWPNFLETAKIILGGMLQNPGVSLALKNEIEDAFLAQANDKRMLNFAEHMAPGPVN